MIRIFSTEQGYTIRSSWEGTIIKQQQQICVTNITCFDLLIGSDSINLNQSVISTTLYTFRDSCRSYIIGVMYVHYSVNSNWTNLELRPLIIIVMWPSAFPLPFVLNRLARSLVWLLWCWPEGSNKSVSVT